LPVMPLLATDIVYLSLITKRHGGPNPISNINYQIVFNEARSRGRLRYIVSSLYLRHSIVRVFDYSIVQEVE